MALGIRRKHSLTGRLTMTLIAMFALAVQPLYGLMTAQVANAATTYTDVPFTPAEVGSNWTVDRALPSGGYGSVSFAGRSDVLEMNFNKDAANMSGTGFYQTEGLKRNTGSSTALKADLYVDNDWITSGKTVRAGLWGVGKEAGGSISAYPIVEFTTDGHTGWRFYDTVTGTWNNSAASFNTNAWNTLEIKLDATTNKVTYHVNNVEIGSASANNATALAETILNSKNYGPTTQSYSAHWSQFGMGTFTVDPPAAPSNLRLNGDKACGFATNINYITPTWDGVSDAVSYNYKVELPNGSVFGPTNVGNVTSVSGAFGGEGTSKFSVQAVAANGLTSAWAPMCAVTYDATAPAMPVHETPANAVVQNSNDFWFDWSDVDGAASYEMQNSTDPAVNGQGSFQNVMWTGDYQQAQPTESRARSVGANGTWYWQVRAVDAAGNKSAWTTPWKVTIDKDVPAAPANLRWTTSSGTIIPDGGATNDVGGVASWDASSSSDIAHYVYRYWNDIEGNQYKPGNEYRVDLGATSLGGVFNQGQGVHHICVEAVDYAGNTSSCTQFTITFDTTPPALTIHSVPDSFGTSRTISGTTEPFAALEVTVHSTPQVKTTVANSAGNWSLFFENLEVSDHTVKVVSTDLGGNISEQTSAFTVLALIPVIQPFVPAPQVVTSPAQPPTQEEATSSNSTPTAEEESGDAVVLNDTSEESVALSDNKDKTEDSVVLSAQDSETGTPLEDTDVLGAQDTTFFGLAWYWWLVILAAIVGGWLLIAAAIRRNRTEE